MVEGAVPEVKVTVEALMVPLPATITTGNIVPMVIKVWFQLWALRLIFLNYFTIFNAAMPMALSHNARA